MKEGSVYAATTPPVPCRRCRLASCNSHESGGRYTLGEDEWLAREILRHILDPLMMIIETDDIQGTTLEEMVVRVWLITTSGDRTGGAPRVVLANDLCEMLGEERIDRELIAMSKVEAS